MRDQKRFFVSIFSVRGFARFLIRIGTYEFDLQAPTYQWILPDGSSGSSFTTESTKDQVELAEFVQVANYTRHNSATNNFEKF